MSKMNRLQSLSHDHSALRVLSLAVVAFAAPLAFGQDGEIFGRVTDPSDAVIPGTSITVRNVGTGLRRTAITSAEGSYLVPFLPPGTYQIVAEKEGFQSVTQAGVVLRVGDRSRIEFQLVVGGVVQTIDVPAESALVNTADATLGNVIENSRMSELPLSGRSALTLVMLTPNVRSSAESAQGFADRGNLVSAFSVAGGPVGLNNITLDGVSNLNIRMNDSNINPTVDAIQEFKVQSGTMSAEHGYTAGGVVSVVTKSGTNNFHGTVYEFFRNDKLDARNAFADTRPPLRYNQYGGSLGGPVLKDKLLFFFNFEEWRYPGSYTTIGMVPTSEERRGDFHSLRDASGNAIPIYDTGTTRANPSGPGLVRDPFPNNVIPSARLDRVSQNILEFYPLPNRVPSDPYTNSNNFSTNLSTNRQARQMALRLDQQFTPKSSLSGRYMLWNHKNDQASQGSGYFPDLIARARNDNYTNRNLGLTHTYIVKPNLINQLRLAVARQYFTFSALSLGQGLVRELGLPQSVPDITLPTVNISGIQKFPSGFGADNGINSQSTFQLVNSLTLIKGRHMLKVGLDLHRNLHHYISCQPCNGSFSFNARLTGNPQQLPGSGWGLASFVLGTVASASQAVNAGLSLQNLTQAYYVQDDWKLSPRLSFNLGLRYDYQEKPWERNNGFSSFNPGEIDPNTGLLGRMEYAGVDFGRTRLQPDFNNFSPRFGFAWDPFGTGKTTLRGGYAVYFPLTFQYSRLFARQGFSNTTAYAAPGGNSDLPAFQFQGGYPFPYVLPLGAASGPSAFLSQSVSVNETKGRDPYSQQYTLTAQRQLPGGYLLELGYSGNKGTKLSAGSYDLNQLDPQYLALGRSLLDTVANPYSGRVPGIFGQSTITRRQLLRPYPYYNNVNLGAPFMGSSIYHAFLLTVEKRMKGGFVLLTSYTFGKVISDGLFAYDQAGTEQVNVLSYQNGKYDRRSERAVDSTDSAGRLVVSGVYELPLGEGKKWSTSNAIARRLIGGWQVNFVLTLQSGLPIVVSGANNNLATRPNSTGISARLDERTAKQWFDTTQFLNPAEFTFGNVSRTLPDVRGPGTRNLDFSTSKSIKIREAWILQFRAESFNISNHVNLHRPNATFVPGPTGRNSSGTFGTIASSRDARKVQLGLKLIF